MLASSGNEEGPVRPGRHIAPKDDCPHAPARAYVRLTQNTVRRRRQTPPITGAPDVGHLDHGAREWVKAYTFLHWTDDGADDMAHLRGSTALRLNGLAALVETR